TSLALLFLSKWRTPIMVSKLVHGPGNDWNNDHNDARNLVEFVSKEMFKKQPLAWQIFDAKRGLFRGNREELLGVTGDLLMSPVAYFNGHLAPQFSDREEEMLKEYVEQGGFLLAEACCGRKEFNEGFRALMKKLFPDQALQPLSAGHQIWSAPFPIKPGSPNLYEYRFLYMHGRRGFEIGETGLDNLRGTLQIGGLLFADACCGKTEFDTAFRAFIKKLFPNEKLERIPPGDELYSKEINDAALTSVRCRRERGAHFRDVPPELEGVKLKNRWVVIYSRYDIGW